MSTIHRLVNQQLAFAQFHLRESATADPFAKRSHQQAALLQTSLGLSAYCAEMLERAGGVPILPKLNTKTLFQEAATALASQGKISLELAECATLSQGQSWLSDLLLLLDNLLTTEPAVHQSSMLKHTTLNENTATELISSNQKSTDNSQEVLQTALAELQVLIQRHRDNKDEY